MVSEAVTLDNATTLKQNMVGSDSDDDPYDMIVREKIRFWNKITRVSDTGVEVAVVLPFDTFIEPFYSTEDMDVTINNCGVHEETEERFKLYSDANGNYKYIQSKTISLRATHSIKSVLCTVYSTDTNGDSANDKIQVELYNGNTWFSIDNATEVGMFDYNGSDLDADLDTSLNSQLSNLDETGTIIFENNLKYRITRVTNDIIYVNKIIIKITWNF